jgi:4-diphosphocytidyl-2-C-methyl-D-erythritol kinase
MEAEAHAKINWTLRVTGRRPDGYHEIETIFQTISLHDTLTFERASGLSLTCDDPAIPTGETNLVLRAARALAVDGVAIHLVKRIPSGGGLGGGSSNAAVTLMALAGMFGIDAPIREIAETLGSDVPFFLLAGTAYATGRGEVLTSIPSPPRIPLLLVMPEERVLTAEAFGWLRRFSSPIGIERSREIARDPAGCAGQLANDFEEPVFERLPQLRAHRDRLLDEGASWAGMSGSGSTIVATFVSDAERDAALMRWRGARVVAAESCGPAR